MVKGGRKGRWGLAWDTLRGQVAELGGGGREAADADSRLLEAEAGAQSLRLDLDDARRLADALRRELEHERGQRNQEIASSLAAAMEPVFKEAAPLVGQLALQAVLLEQGKAVTARDVMALARALARVVEKQGLTPLARPEQTVPYDAAVHIAQGRAPGQGVPRSGCWCRATPFREGS